MASTGMMEGEMNVDGVYGQAFGNLPHKTRYYDPLGLKADGESFAGSDFRAQIAQESAVRLKAQTTSAGGVGTTGYAMIPVYVDPRIVDQTRKFTPLVELIPRVSNRGLTADYNVITGKGGGFTAPEDGALAETNTTYDRQSTQIKFLYSVGRVTGPSQSGQPAYSIQGFEGSGSGIDGGFSDASAPNSLQQEVLVKARELAELQENLIVNGDADTTATEFSGIVKLMGATNTVDKNNAALDLEDVHTAVRYAFDDGGRPNLAVASSAAYEDLQTLISAKIGYLASTTQAFWGFSALTIRTMVGDVPIIPSMYLTNSGGSKAIYFLDLSVVEMRVLQDVMYEELAKTNDSRKFMLKCYEALIIKNPAFCASITEIA
jgi:hypothetical protein